MSEYLQTLHREHAARRGRLFPEQPPRIAAGWPNAPKVKPYKFKRAKIYREWGDPAKAQKFIPGLTAQQVIAAVRRHYRVRTGGIISPIRTPRLVKARHMAMYLCREFLSNGSFPELGWQFGRRHHSTCLNACQLVAVQLRSDPKAKTAHDKIRAMLFEIADRA